ncbi:transcription initiation factor TFIID subunit 11 [Marasmius crinis-equi]|uniref:Transcription initiation factor TFIID subunit 11 n=1 Tax=Marasmius crinis-equi TaxID=585013 RepID=A0ABR3FF71_9AGAR
MSVPPDAQYAFSASPSPPAPSTPTPHAGSGRAKGSGKRGRKPRGGGTGTASPRAMTADITASASPAVSSPQFQQVNWSLSNSSGAGPSSNASVIQGPSFAGPKAQSSVVTSGIQAYGSTSQQTPTTPGGQGYSSAFLQNLAASAGVSASALEAAGLNPSGAAGGAGAGRVGSLPPVKAGGDEDGEADDELFPAMADDDYSAQLHFQSQSKDNLKVLMENLSTEQYDRFEAYRRHALPKQAIRKVIQQTVGAQVSQPVAQIIAGFSKVFVGEIVEKARAVQARRGETGPLSPDHLREAYRLYQEETGKVGAARPVRAKKLFVR